MTENCFDPAKLADAHRAALDDVNRWRGHCVDCFARIDEAIAETLRSFVAPGKPIPPLFGSRLAALENEVAENGVNSVAGAPTLRSLKKLGNLDLDRNIVVHATGSVWVNPHGKWIYRYCFTPSGKGKVEQVGYRTCTEAKRLEAELSAAARSLIDRLRDLRKVVEAQKPPR